MEKVHEPNQGFRWPIGSSPDAAPDFGVGKLFAGEDDLVRKTEGTPFFLAPEACRGEYGQAGVG